MGVQTQATAVGKQKKSQHWRDQGLDEKSRRNVDEFPERLIGRDSFYASSSCI